MRFNGDISLGKGTLTRQQYMQERGDKNGHPVDWKPEHSHTPGHRKPD